MGLKQTNRLVVYYESLKRALKTKTMYGYRSDERLKTNVEESTRLGYTLWNMDRGLFVYYESLKRALTPSTALIFEVRLNQNFVENIPRKNTTITTFHAVSKEGTGLFTDFPNFCLSRLFFCFL